LFSFTDTLLFLFFVSVSDGSVCQLWLAGKEPHQPFQILGYCCQVKLFTHELDPAQPQSAQPNQILQFREQRFTFLRLRVSANYGVLATS